MTDRIEAGARVSWFADDDFWGTVTAREGDQVTVDWDEAPAETVNLGRLRLRPTGPRPARTRPRTYDEELIEAGQCPEIVPVMTEDGPSDGRCLADIVPGGFACPPHTEAIEAWRAMSEPERAHWERQHDAEAW
jgi:hypothetical protein